MDSLKSSVLAITGRHREIKVHKLLLATKHRSYIKLFICKYTVNM